MRARQTTRSTDQQNPRGMLSFEDALQRVLDAAPRLDTVKVPLVSAGGRVLARSVHATCDLPAFDYSAMDGYAVACRTFGDAVPDGDARSIEKRNAGGDASGDADRDANGDGSPNSDAVSWKLPVTGESRTGHATPALREGSAMRIFTGARIPDGADAVVIQENVTHHGDNVRFTARPNPGDHIRRAGEDLARDGLACAEGTRLGPFQLGLLASLDIVEVPVAARPRVTILSTGDELRAPGSAPRAGSIPESNSLPLQMLATGAGAMVHRAAHVGDEDATTETAVRDALQACDLLVTVGGVSVGAHDRVRPALEAAGVQLDFWKVAIKPGKPLVLGRAGSTVVLGLPGNPVSAQLTFLLFGLPLLRAMQGQTRVDLPYVRARLTDGIAHKPGRRGFYRGRLHGEEVAPLSGQASGAWTSLAWADALIVAPEAGGGLEAGDQVKVLRLAEL